MVYGVCRLILRDATEAEDAAQQTFLSAYRGLLAGQEPREPSAWLGTIARNECRHRLRSRRAEPLTLVTEPSGDETQREVGRRAEAEALCAALAELPPQQRDAIVLREFYGLSYAEVAAALGLTGAAVETLLFRSRRRLQEHLRPLRAALGVLAVPPSLADSLAQALPGFGGSAAGAGVAAKIAVATLALGTAGTVAGVEGHSYQSVAQHRLARASKIHRVVQAKAEVRTEVPAPAPIAPARRVSFVPAQHEVHRHRETQHEAATASSEASGRDGGGGGGGESSSGGGSSSHDGGSTTTTTTEGEHGSGSGGDDHRDGGSSGGDATTTTAGGGDSGSSGGDG